MLSRTPRSARGRKEPLPDGIKTKLTSAALDETATMLVIPVNFGNSHWTVVIIFKDRHEIIYYDSLGAKNTANTLQDVAMEAGTILSEALGKGFSKTSMNSPIQFDGFACGIFVCHKVARMLDRTISNDVSPIGLTNFRFRLIVYVLYSEKI
jgi:Ulp1 family protease